MADSQDTKEPLALFSTGPTYDSPSFANLLKSVLTSNSPPFGFQGQIETSQKGNVGVIKPKVTRVHLKVQSGPSNEHPEIAIQPNSPMMLHKDVPSLLQPHEKSDHNTPPSHIVKEQPLMDGYSWRKYGQKQVKNSKSSRSYYRCSHSSCHAKKKVQHSDQSGHVIDIIYMGDHNHEIVQNKRIVSRVPLSDVKLGTTHWEDSRQSSVQMGETEQHSWSSSNGKCEGHDGNKPESDKLFTDAEVQQKHDSESGFRKRLNETSVKSTSVLGANKESKTVVRTSPDVAISSDGYRWRKYGQKTVKGSCNSRSYYRCTFSGCTAHKHVERVPNDATETIITYLRNHNHDMPVAKKQKVSQSLSSQLVTTKRSMDAEGDFTDEEVLELGGKEALESARTLLAFSALESN